MQKGSKNKGISVGIFIDWTSLVATILKSVSEKYEQN